MNAAGCNAVLHAPAPAAARHFLDAWHRGECLVAIAAFGFIAAVLIVDLAGRELE